MDAPENLPALAVEFLPLPSLIDERLRFCIDLFAKQYNVVDIKRLYTEFWGEPPDPVELMNIPNRYAAEIQDAEQVQLRDLSKRQLAHAALRYDKLQEGMDEAWKEQVIRTVRTGETEWTPVMARDLDNFYKAIDLSRKEDQLIKQTLLAVAKLGIERERVNNDRTVTVDLGEIDGDNQ